MEVAPISTEPQHIGSSFYRKVLFVGGIASGLLGIAYLALAESASDLDRSKNQSIGISAALGCVVTLAGVVFLSYCKPASKPTQVEERPIRDYPPLSGTYIEAAEDTIGDQSVEQFEQLLGEWNDWKSQFTDFKEFAEIISSQTPVEGKEPPFVTLCQILQSYFNFRTSVFPVKVHRMDGNPDIRSPMYDADDLHVITEVEKAFYAGDTPHARLREMYNTFIEENQHIADNIEDNRYQSYFVKDELEPSENETTRFLKWRGMLPS
ncbi:MAG: hypothetical protein Q8K75_05650 [Chlamydiales bacterium]|nr:hypothetical protein [Chlamydiales bacterium]